MVKETSPLARTKKAAALAVEALRQGVARKELNIAEKEMKWLDIMSSQIDTIPDDPDKLWYEIQKELDLAKWIPAEYDLKVD
jgi:methanol--5-hydroxybenzimidazolylcobamide Co-methyltransferase